jgi:hypothetical protein
MLVVHANIRRYLFCFALAWPAWIVSFPAKSQSNSEEILFSKKLFRDDVMFFGVFRDLRGTLFLKKDSLLFVVDKPENKRFSFALHYKQIKSIRRTYWTLFPNRIGIRTTDDRSYSLRSYKRKRVIEIARERMKVFASP